MEKKERIALYIKAQKTKKEDVELTIKAIKMIIDSGLYNGSDLKFLQKELDEATLRESIYYTKIHILEESLRRREETGVLQHEGKYEWSKRE